MGKCHFDLTYKLGKDHTKEEFLRAVLVKLASTPGIPADAVKSNFKISESYEDLIQCKGYVSSDYSVLIGYDEKEQYRTTANKVLDAGDFYTYEGIGKIAPESGTYRVDTIKTRTVTRWSPYSGHTSGDYTTHVTGYGSITSDRITEVLKATKAEAEIIDNYTEPSDGAISAAKELCRKGVEAKINFPGDHHKDFKSEASVRIDSLKLYQIPVYTATFVYNGVNYRISDYAAGNFDIQLDSVSSLSEINTKIAASLKPLEKPWIVAKNVGWCLYLLLVALGFAAIPIAGYYRGWILVAGFLCVMYVFRMIVRIPFSIQLKKVVFGDMRLKLMELESVLAQMKMKKLSQSEEGHFVKPSKKDIKAYSGKPLHNKFDTVCSFFIAPLTASALATTTFAAFLKRTGSISTLGGFIAMSVILFVIEFALTDLFFLDHT